MRRDTMIGVVTIAGWVLVGCSDEDRSVGIFGEDTGAMSATATLSAGGTDDASSGSNTATVSGTGNATEDTGDDPTSGSDTLKLDVGSMETGGTGECIEGECNGCTAVDLLFVIDNSVSMNDYQVALGQAFPSFAQAIIQALPPETSLHVGVTSTTMGDSNSGSTTNCMATGDNMMPQEAFYITPDQQDNGIVGAQGRLYPALGKSYFDISTSAGPQEVQELEAWFAEAAHIGESGSQIEMSAAGAAWATHPANDPVNSGFLRDKGAVLVIFFIQDEPDQTPPAEANALVTMIADAKTECGGMDCVVGGGFVDMGCLPQVALGTLLDNFGAPAVLDELPNEDDVTPQTFEPLLVDTLSQVIAQKCEEIEPEG